MRESCGECRGSGVHATGAGSVRGSGSLTAENAYVAPIAQLLRSMGTYFVPWSRAWRWWLEFCATVLARGPCPLVWAPAPPSPRWSRRERLRAVIFVPSAVVVTDLAENTHKL